MAKKICLASADGHIGAPSEVYKDYLEKWLHPAFDEYFARHVSRWSCVLSTSFYPPDMNIKFRVTEGFDPGHGTSITWDPNLRLKAMDQSMIACEVLLPDDTNNNDPPFGSGLANAMVDGPEGSLAYPSELVRAGARAYNRWQAEFCSADPNRLKGLIMLGTLDDVVWCVDEIHRAYDSGLNAGLMLPLEYYLPLYHHPRYDILWETCSELNLPIISHIGRGTPHYLGEDPRVQLFMYSQELNWAAQRPIWCLIMGGVLERFPNLRLVVTEAGVHWVAGLLAGLDASFSMWPAMQASRDVERRVNFSLKPSEYWQRQCYVTHSASQRRPEFEGDFYDGIPNIIFGADLGHMEGWWPVVGMLDPVPEGVGDFFKPLPETTPVDQAYKATFGGLPAAKILPYLQDNFFKAYPNIDRASLNDVVDRVCPTLQDVGLV
jgi:predicted TIM-barrel fold metal-dependent hydrolase